MYGEKERERETGNNLLSDVILILKVTFHKYSKLIRALLDQIKNIYDTLFPLISFLFPTQPIKSKFPPFLEINCSNLLSNLM